MFLAFKEMRRAKARFALLVAAIGLLVLLILFQQTLQNGLLDAFVGAIRTQSSPVLVYSVDGRRNLQGSVITPELEQTIRSVDGVGAAGKIAQRSLPATAGGSLTQVAMIGYETPDLGAPTELVEGRLANAPGEVVASDVDRDDGFDIGDTVVIEPGRQQLTVVGLASDAQLLAAPTLYGSYDTYALALRAFNPDVTDDPLPSVIGLSPSSGVTPDELVRRVNAASDDTDALTRSDAADQTPGVDQIRQSFQVIFLLYGLVVPFVTGLFFLILTLQKANALTLLRAIGAPARRLVSALMVQVVCVILAGVALGTLAYTPIANQKIGGIALRFDAGAVVFWAVLLLVLGVLSALFSARRVLRIDPIEATTGAGVDR
jgi:putative ABC transport system permease protein